MKKVLILANHFITIFAFRKELVSELLDHDIEVFIILPRAQENKYFKDLGCKIIEVPIDRRGTNPISDLKLLISYIRIIKEIKPNVVLTYTIKPNVYGGIAARLTSTKIIHTVTGLGTVYIQEIWQRKIIAFLNRISFKKAKKIFFLNKENREFYKQLRIIDTDRDTLIVPGSGVNLNIFKFHEPVIKDTITFTFIGRILKDKGIDEFLIAAQSISSNYNNVRFRIVGFVDEDNYFELLKDYENKGVIEYLGKRDDIPEVIKNSDCIVLPSYGEGRGTVLQEGAAIGRPLITTDTYGCRENVEDGYNGFLCKVADSESLENAMEKFIKLPPLKRVSMGNRSREKAENEFDRKIVTRAYLKEVMDTLR